MKNISLLSTTTKKTNTAPARILYDRADGGMTWVCS